MKKIILLFISLMGSQCLFAQDFTGKELVSLYKLSLNEVEAEVLKKGYLPNEFPVDQKAYYTCVFRKPNSTDRQIEIRGNGNVPEKFLRFYTDYWEDWLALKKEMEASEFIFNKDCSKIDEQRLCFDYKNIRVTLFIVQYESGADDTYMIMIDVPQIF